MIQRRLAQAAMAGACDQANRKAAAAVAQHEPAVRCGDDSPSGVTRFWRGTVGNRLSGLTHWDLLLY